VGSSPFHRIGNDKRASVYRTDQLSDGLRLGKNGVVGSCELTNIPPVGARKKAGILDSGLVNHQMVAGVRFELTTFGLCDLTQLSLRVGLYLHPE
jgi:hypothetical protein